MAVKVLGTGCSNCKKLAANATEALKLAGRQDVVEEVHDLSVILAYGVTSTPALVVDDHVVVAGRVPTPKQLVGFFQK